MPYPQTATLVTEERVINNSDSWETQTDWEDNQEASYIVIENGIVKMENLSVDDAVFTFESGDLSNWDSSSGSIITNPVNERMYACSVNDNSDNVLYSTTGSGLNKYPAPDGTQFIYAHRSVDSGDHRFGWGFQTTPPTNVDGYQIQHRPANNRYELAVDGSTLDTDSTPPPIGEWTIQTVTWGSSGNISVTIEDTNGNQIASLSATDTTYTSQGGVHISGRDTGNGGEALFDGELTRV